MLDETLLTYLKDNEMLLKHSQINELFDNWPNVYSGQELLDPLFETINFLPYLRYEVPMYFARYSKKLEKVEGLSDNITEIGIHGFSDCPNLSSVILPPNTELINSFAFLNCPKLTYIQVPSTIKVFGDGCFITRGANLTIDYQGTLKEYIDIEATPETPPFADSYDLILKDDIKNCLIPVGVSRVPSYKFFYCNNMETLMVPKTTKYISAGAFEGCYNLTEVELHCCSIGEESFAHCVKLKTLLIGTELTSIRDGAFRNTAITNIIYQGTINQFKSIVMPNDAFLTGTLVQCNNGEFNI